MTSLLDTSVLVRYLTGDPPNLAVASAALIDSNAPLAVADAVIAETFHVLRSIYGIDREQIVNHLIELLLRRNINVFRADKDAVLEALMLSRPSGRVSVVDALTWAAAHSPLVERVYTFDRRFPADRIDVRTP